MVEEDLLMGLMDVLGVLLDDAVDEEEKEDADDVDAQGREDQKEFFIHIQY